jgi:putative oxidoreductase
VYLHNEPKPDMLTSTSIQMAVAWGELIGGVALLAGLLTRVAALGLLIIQGGAVYTLTQLSGFSLGAPGGGGYQFNLALLAMCLALILMGGGKLSIDHVFTQRRKKATEQSAHKQGMAPVA